MISNNIANESICCSNFIAPLTIALAGNPNCGKSALFNALTGIRQTTGNWPGVTVERKEGVFELDDRRIQIIDLPGIYSLDAQSSDEIVTRDYLLSRAANLIINVLDAANLERNLYLTIQLLELGVPIVVALNMMDVAQRRGLKFDLAQFANALGCPVVPVVAVTKQGLTELQARLLAVAEGRESAGVVLEHGDCVEAAIADLVPLLTQSEVGINRRWLALKLLESDPDAVSRAGELAVQRAMMARQQIAARIGEDADLHIADTRFGHAHTVAQQVLCTQQRCERTLSDRIDQIVLNRILGIPLFLFVMYLMFLFTMNIGGVWIDFFDRIGQAIFVDGVNYLFIKLGAPDWLNLLVAEGIGNGVRIVGTFIPIIASLYIALSFLEDSGYMARAAFVMDRFMRAIGLPGKAFVPLIVGFGCNVPAVMATRTLESERERKLTILMNPFMSCGGRLPVYVLFITAFFPSSGQNLVFILYLTGILVAILVGLAMKYTLLQGASSGLLMELPPYHMPTLRGVLLRTWDRIRLFVRAAGKIIVLMVLALQLLTMIGSDLSFDHHEMDNSMLAIISRAATPLFAPLGIHQDNWPAVLGIFSGVLAKEVIVGTLEALYSNMSGERISQPVSTSFDLKRAFQEAGAAVIVNLKQLKDRLLDPLGFSNQEVKDTQSLAARSSHNSAMRVMMTRFDGQAGAFAYLLLVLLYTPCVATIGAIVREAGTTWALFVGCWTAGIAYGIATLFYQIAIWERNPGSAALWIGSELIILIIILIGLRIWARSKIFKL